MPYSRGEFALYYNGQIEEMVVIDEVLEAHEYAVRFLDSDDVFTARAEDLYQSSDELRVVQDLATTKIPKRS
jgi:hypothetical protein